MTAQSSFLIRCWLGTAPDSGTAKAYHIQHVQTGAEFRAHALAEVIQWMNDTNTRYLADTLAAMSDDVNSGTSEDLR